MPGTAIRQTVEANGIGREFEERAKAMGAAVPESQSLSYEIDSEGFKLVADALVQEAGIHPMLHRMFVAPIMDGDTITGIIVESKAGREAILAKRVIDATGDADVAHRAGAPTITTPVEQMQAASVMFHLAGVDKKAFMAGVQHDPQTYKDWATGEWQIETSGKEDAMFSPFLKKPFAQAIRDGVIPAHLNTIAGTWGAMHDTGELTYMNLVHLAGCDGTDPDSLTQFEIEGRKQAMLAIEALRRYTPGCDGARLRNFGMTIGIRDTRKIDAAYNMTEHDVREQARFDDSVGIYPEFIDGYGVLILPTTGRYMHVPYRSHAAQARAEPAGDRPRHRRRPDRPCGDPQHGLLRRGRPGRRHCGRAIDPQRQALWTRSTSRSCRRNCSARACATSDGAAIRPQRRQHGAHRVRHRHRLATAPGPHTHG